MASLTGRPRQDLTSRRAFIGFVSERALGLDLTVPASVLTRAEIVGRR